MTFCDNLRELIKLKKLCHRITVEKIIDNVIPSNPLLSIDPGTERQIFVQCCVLHPIISECARCSNAVHVVQFDAFLGM